MDNLCQARRCICYKRVEIHPPDPVVLPGVDDALDHVELKPRNAPFRMGFIINI